MQTTIHASEIHGPAPIGARLVASLLGLALLVTGVGSAWAVVAAPDAPGLDRAGPALELTGEIEHLRMPNGAPGDAAVSYTTVARSATAPAAVRLYGDVTGALAADLAVTITRGTGEDAAWVPDRGGDPIFLGTLATMSTDWASGLGDADVWQPGERHTFRIEVTLLDHPAAQGATAEATFRWEARPTS